MTTILLVEDEELNRVLVRAVLARAGDATVRSARLVEAPTLADAREQLSREAVDVVLLDMNLPDGHGLTLVDELVTKGPPVGAQRPSVIALTASVLPQDKDAAARAGCDGFLDKPYAAADLVSALSEQIAKRATGA